MKYILILYCCFQLTAFAQNENLNFVLYETYQDFENKNGESLGEFTGYSSDPLSFKIRYINADGKKKSKAVNKKWGFSIGEYLFRYKTGRWNSPMLVIGVRDKVFYYEGELYLSSFGGSLYGTTGNTKNLVLYSDDLESKFIKIKQLPKNEKSNPLYAELGPCIEKGLKRYGYNPKFQALTTCINDFLSEE